MEWQFSWQIGIFLLANVALLTAYIVYYLPPLSSSKPIQNLEAKVSVIICAKNEAYNMEKNIPHWCSQKNISFEVIVVNDHSTDHSANVLQKFAHEFDHLKWIDSDSPLSSRLGKKHALSQAIRAASGNVLLLTDADCQPSSSFWVARMAEKFQDPEVGVVAGYAPVESVYPGLLARLQYLDSVITAIQYLSAIRRKDPYMVVGRNVAYRREAYPDKELLKQMKYPSGDDDLVFQSVDPKWKIKTQVHPEALVLARGVKSWNRWFRQKRRHFNVAPVYSLRKSSVPVLFRMMQLLWIVGLILFLTHAVNAYILVSLLPLIGLGYVLYRWRSVLQLERGFLFVFLEPLRYLVVVSVTLSLMIKRPTKW
mgnify:CR=1 FL=1